MALPVMTESQLLQMAQSSANDAQLLTWLVHSTFAARLLPISSTAITINETHRGGILRFTSNSPITVTLPMTLDPGFLFSFIPYGSGAISFSGTTIGGTGSGGQYISGSCLLLDTGEWLVSGGA